MVTDDEESEASNGLRPTGESAATPWAVPGPFEAEGESEDAHRGPEAEAGLDFETEGFEDAELEDLELMGEDVGEAEEFEDPETGLEIETEFDEDVGPRGLSADRCGPLVRIYRRDAGHRSNRRTRRGLPVEAVFVPSAPAGRRACTKGGARKQLRGCSPSCDRLRSTCR